MRDLSLKIMSKKIEKHSYQKQYNLYKYLRMLKIEIKSDIIPSF